MYGRKLLCSIALVLMFFSAGAEEKLLPQLVKGSASVVGMTLSKNVLYTAGWDKRMEWYDVSVPNKPVKLGSFPGVFGRQMVVADDRLYITARQQGIWIFDIKDPRSPMLIRRFDTVEMATGLAISGDLAVTAERIYGSPIYSVADPAHPRLVNILRGGEIQSCVFRYPMFYGASWGSGRIYVWDLSDPMKPKKCSTLQLGGFGDGVTISGDYLYAATGMHRRRVPKDTGKNDGWGLEIFDLKADPAKPKPVGSIHFPPKTQKHLDSWTVQVSQDIAYVGASTNGVFIVDVKNKKAPQLLGHFILNPGEKITDCVGAVAVGKGVLYIGTLKQGLWVLPYSAAVPVEKAAAAEPKGTAIPPVRITGFTVYPTEFQARRLALDGDTLYAALGNGGLGIYAVSEVGLKQIKKFPGKCVYDVCFSRGRLYAAEGIDGMGIYELKGRQLEEIGRMKENCYVLHLLSDPRWLAYSSGGMNFFFADIRNPKNIKRVFSHFNRGLFYIDTLGDADFAGLYPVSGHAGGFYWIDLRGAKPKILSHSKKKVAEQLSGICRFGSKLFVAGGKNFLLLEPGEDPVAAETFAGGKRLIFSGICAADGSIVALSQRNLGTLQVYDLADPEKPVLQKNRSFKSMLCNPDRPVFWKGRLIIPGGFAGILFENWKAR